MLSKFWKWLCEFFNEETSYRSEAGVRIIFNKKGLNFRVDLDDEQTKEIFRKRFEDYAQYDIVDGKLVKKGGSNG